MNVYSQKATELLRNLTVYTNPNNLYKKGMSFQTLCVWNAKES